MEVNRDISSISPHKLNVPPPPQERSQKLNGPNLSAPLKGIPSCKESQLEVPLRLYLDTVAYLRQPTDFLEQ